MTGRNVDLIPRRIDGAGPGKIFQTDANDELQPIDTTGALDGAYLARNTTTGLWEVRNATGLTSGQKFSVAFPFFNAGEFWDLPMGRFPSVVKAWTARLSGSGNATFTVAKMALGTSPADMVGAGTDPAVSAALDAIDVDVTDWDETDLAADEMLRVTCNTLTATQVTLTLHFERA